MKILIASDHSGIKLKSIIKTYLAAMKQPVEDYGTFDEDSVDYPDYAHKVCMDLTEQDKGILICGSGIGMSIAANRHKHIRAALCHNARYAELARKHNDANVLVLGARFLEIPQAIEITKIFFTTEFEGGRHIKRIKKL